MRYHNSQRHRNSVRVWPTTPQVATTLRKRIKKTNSEDPAQKTFLKATRLAERCCHALDELQGILDSHARTDAFHSYQNRSKAERYISTLEKQVNIASCNVKHMANSIRPPINRLPREIFTMILSYVRDEVVYGHSMSVPLLANWVFSMTPMLVCRQWRQAILTTPLFWVNVYNVDREQMRLSLARAGSAHLELRLFNRQSQVEFADTRTESSAENTPFLQAFEMNNEDYQSLVAPMFPKLRGLFMDVTCEDNNGKLPTWFTDYVSPLPAPHLRSLYIELFLPPLIAAHAPDPQIVDALPMILGGSTPQLKEIKLSYFTTWPHNSFTNLTKVFLFRQSQNRVSLFEFLEFLRQSPQLEDLALMHAGPDISLMEISPTLHNAIGGPDDAAIQQVTLNKLQHLDISAWVSPGAVGTFIQHLVIPETTVVAIWDMSDNITDSESVALLLPLVICPDSDVQQTPPRRDDRPKTLRLTDLSVVGRYTPLFLCTQDSIHLNGGLALRQTLLPFSSVGMLSRLEELHLARVDRVIWNSAPVLTEAEWTDLLRCMPQLERLFLDDTSAVAIVKALTVSADLQMDEAESRVPCPRLRCLSLTFGQLDEYITVHFPLSMMVTLRALKGYPLETLHVNSGNSYLMAYASAVPGELASLQTRGIVNKVVQNERDLLPPSVSPDWPTPAYKWLNVV